MAAQILVPYLIGVVLDAMYKQEYDLITDYCLQMLGVVLLSALTTSVRAYTFNKLSEEVAAVIRYDLFWSILNKDVSFFDENKTGELLSRITADTMVMQSGLGTTISMFIRNFVGMCGSLFALIYISWKLTAVTMCGLVLIVIISKIVLKKISTTQKEVQALKA